MTAVDIRWESLIPTLVVGAILVMAIAAAASGIVGLLARKKRTETVTASGTEVPVSAPAWILLGDAPFPIVGDNGTLRGLLVSAEKNRELFQIALSTVLERASNQELRELALAMVRMPPEFDPVMKNVVVVLGNRAVASGHHTYKKAVAEDLGGHAFTDRPADDPVRIVAERTRARVVALL